jgi:hypothetical protein
VLEISRFLGIVIGMFYRDHQPPHFHATYGDYEITVGIDDGIVTGKFPRRALGHVLEWYQAHRDELRQNWELAKARKPLRPIAPLE